MLMTMVDTKVINNLTDSSSQSCYVCGAKPSQMNKLGICQKLSIREENLKYGISPLHFKIKCLEICLKISYKLQYQKTSLRGATAQEKKEVEDRKTRVQKKLWEELGIKVDMVVQGTGTSNTGNTARRFLKDPKKSAKATGVDEKFIERLGTINEVCVNET